MPNLKNILMDYEQEFGQRVNLSKYTLDFIPNTTNSTKVVTRDTFGILSVNCHKRYLRLLAMAGRNKKKTIW